MTGEASPAGPTDGGPPRFVITGGAGPAEVAAVVAVLSAAVAAGAAGSGPAAATPDGRTPRALWAASLGPGLRSAITWRTSSWW